MMQPDFGPSPGVATPSLPGEGAQGQQVQAVRQLVAVAVLLLGAAYSS